VDLVPFKTCRSGIGEAISRIRGLTGIPVAVLTNGSLLGDPDVRSALSKADLVIPSPDAGEEVLFRHVNRPFPGLRFEDMVEGLAAFGAPYRGELRLEVFLPLPGEVRWIAKPARRLSPDRVPLNTVARPPAERRARPVPPDRMKQLASWFQGRVEVVAAARRARRRAAGTDGRDVLDFIRRRPGTIQDVAEGLGLNPSGASKCFASLVERGLVTSEPVGNKEYYRVKGPD
jgi:wyosine [tRNA(Phe)-imidazoG37] synthetase (radical SAM superfamily)